ncbi:MAG: ABC transporter substrate binding protein [Kiloniellales bacterium]|nr:ABC transporter substrate binding protein [Kiloniellales bacterium]
MPLGFLWTFRRGLHRLGLSLILSCGVLAGTAAASTEPAYYDWFRPSAENQNSWLLEEVQGQPDQIRIRSSRDRGVRDPRRIVVLFPRPSSAYDAAMNKILDLFSEKKIEAEIRAINFRRDGHRGRRALAEAEAWDAELIFSMGSESTAWLWKHYRDGRIPVVSVCSKDPVLLGQARGYEVGSGTNFAFTSLNMPVEAQMAYLMELKPNLKNLGILVDSKNLSAVETQAKPMLRYAAKRGIRVLYLDVKNPNVAAKELTSLVDRAVTTMRKNDPTLDRSLFWVTGSTAVFREIESINASSDRVPVLSVVPDVVRAGDDSAVLSIGIGFQSNAHLAAIYGIDVLEGRVRVGEVGVGIVSPPDIAINFRKAREIGLKIPFGFLERATFVYDYQGRMVRRNGEAVDRAE